MRSFSIKSFMQGWLAIIALLLLASCGKSDSSTASVGSATVAAATNSQELFNTFAAALTGAEETPPTQSAAPGSGTLVVDSDNRSAIATVTTTGIQGTAAHIHEGAPGVSGPVLFPLSETSTGSGIWTAKITLTEAQFNSLQAGNFYFNVHSAAFPNGEIRGQLRLQKLNTSTTSVHTAASEQTVTASAYNSTDGGSAIATSRSETTTGTGTTTATSTAATASGNGQATSTASVSSAFTAALRGSQETPPNSSTALGAGAAVVDAATRSLVVAVAAKGITGTEAHVHLAPPGVAGPVIIPLVETSRGSGVWTAKAALSQEQYNALVAGNLYLNVHSTAFPAGEIRDQLLPVQQQSISVRVNGTGMTINGSVGTTNTGGELTAASTSM